MWDFKGKVTGCLLFFVISCQVSADVQISGTYTNMGLSGGEDLSGMEILIVGATDGYHALVQCAQSEPMPPVLVNLTVNEPNITFNLPATAKTGCDGTKATGKVTAAGIELSFGPRHKSVLIKRGVTFWNSAQSGQD